MQAAAPDQSRSAAALPLQLDIGYVQAPQDACLAWLRRKYVHGVQPPAADSGDGENSAGVKAKKPHLDAGFLQRLENDVAACDQLRWRAFAFPSHPTQPLNTSYRPEPAKAAGTPATAVELHQHKGGKTSAAAGSDGIDNARAAPYSLLISTRADAEARRRAKKEKGNAKGSGAVAPPGTVTELLETAVRKEKQAHWCRVLGEEDVGHEPPQLSAWVARSWRPLLGGYVSAPNRTEQARFLFFPQSGHPSVDLRDLKAATIKSLGKPQSVTSYLRGTACWNVEERNPAAAAASSAASGASGGALRGLHHSLTYAQTFPASPASVASRNWVDAVEVSAALQQSRTERQYAPERAKVQRVTLLEDSVSVTTSEGDPRHSRRIAATNATVHNSGVKRQHDTSAAASVEEAGKKSKKKRHAKEADTTEPTSAASDDAIVHLCIEDAYDSSVQQFALPGFWQRWVRASSSARAAAADSGAATGSLSLDRVPRGSYRVRWSGGPGIELCQLGPGTEGPDVSCPAMTPPPSLLTVLGRLWTESWVRVPLSPRWSLTLRNQSAVVVPLEPNAQRQAPMVPDAEAAETNGHASSTALSSVRSRMCAHPYFWATQGPRWDAALVRGFQNDYSGMHHARRWYSILSAELTLEGGKQKGGSSGGKRGRNAADASAVLPAPEADDSGDENAAGSAAVVGAPPERAEGSAAGRWRGTSLTAFANACVVDTVRDYPRASVGLSFVSQIPRLSITAFNEVIPRRFECSFSWFAAFKPRGGESGGAGGFGVELRSGLPQPEPPATGPSTAGAAASAPIAADGMPLLRVSPVETFQHMKCGLTWRFDE